MTLQGTIHKEGSNTFVRYETTFENEPIRQVLFWRVERVTRSPYTGAFPEHGDIVMSSGDEWHGKGYSVYVLGSRQADKIERTAVECPPTRGKPTRWYRGRWEKLMAKGWIPA